MHLGPLRIRRPQIQFGPIGRQPPVAPRVSVVASRIDQWAFDAPRDVVTHGPILTAAVESPQPTLVMQQADLALDVPRQAVSHGVYRVPPRRPFVTPAETYQPAEHYPRLVPPGANLVLTFLTTAVVVVPQQADVVALLDPDQIVYGPVLEQPQAVWAPNVLVIDAGTVAPDMLDPIQSGSRTQSPSHVFAPRPVVQPLQDWAFDAPADRVMHGSLPKSTIWAPNVQSIPPDFAVPDNVVVRLRGVYRQSPPRFAQAPPTLDLPKDVPPDVASPTGISSLAVWAPRAVIVPQAADVAAILDPARVRRIDYGMIPPTRMLFTLAGTPPPEWAQSVSHGVVFFVAGVLVQQPVTVDAGTPPPEWLEAVSHPTTLTLAAVFAPRPMVLNAGTVSPDMRQLLLVGAAVNARPLAHNFAPRLLVVPQLYAEAALAFWAPVLWRGRNIARPPALSARNQELLNRVFEATSEGGKRRLDRFTQLLSNIINSLQQIGQLTQDGVGRWAISGVGATVGNDPPTIFDDGVAGFRLGSLWYSRADRQVYVLIDSTTGAAVWATVNPTGLTGSFP